ncbi:MAG: tetratricopeptide repeat protein, partial [Sphingomonadaceae bacterium]
MRQICFLPSAIALAGAAAATWPSGAAAQGREVVQALPSQASEELTQALSRLARSPRDLDALIAAGTASLELGDVDAAMGFFGRAYDLAPSDPRIKAGQAAAYVRTQRPVEALKLFEEAEAAGVEIVRLSGDYGLAYDLVGNNREAQARYRMARARRADDEVVRRLALSLAIAGDESGFEEALRPLLSNRDFGAYRTRAFGLAILGRADEAVAIAEAVMPRDMARRIEDYLRFMPRLTKAQQAAAGNLGIYPTAGRIGRDDPRIAALVVAETPPERRSRNADEDLAPSGAPLGPRAAVEASSRAEVATELDDEEVVVATPSRREAERTVRSARREVAADPLSRTRRRPRIIERAATPTPPPPPPPPSA